MNEISRMVLSSIARNAGDIRTELGDLSALSPSSVCESSDKLLESIRGLERGIRILVEVER